jgi:hypothetical protein
MRDVFYNTPLIRVNKFKLYNHVVKMYKKLSILLVKSILVKSPTIFLKNRLEIA